MSIGQRSPSRAETRGALFVLEFSRTTRPIIDKIYDFILFAFCRKWAGWSPGSGGLSAWLNRSRFPPQEQLKAMLTEAGSGRVAIVIFRVESPPFTALGASDARTTNDAGTVEAFAPVWDRAGPRPPRRALFVGTARHRAADRMALKAVRRGLPACRPTSRALQRPAPLHQAGPSLEYALRFIGRRAGGRPVGPARPHPAFRRQSRETNHRSGTGRAHGRTVLQVRPESRGRGFHRASAFRHNHGRARRGGQNSKTRYRVRLQRRLGPVFLDGRTDRTNTTETSTPETGQIDPRPREPSPWKWT